MNDKRYLLLPAIARVMVSQFSDVITYKTIGIEKVACEASFYGTKRNAPVGYSIFNPSDKKL